MGDAGTERRLRRLRWYNLLMGAFHAAQGVAILALANGFALPVTASFLETQPGAAPPQLRTLFEIRLAWGVAAFVFLSALAHWLLASPGINDWYVRNLKRERNYGRWMEYSVTASLMIVVIAMLSGIYDLPTLILLFFLNAMMILFGWMMELHNQTTERTDWTAFIFGCIAGAVPWVMIFLYFISAAADSTNAVPGFVYGIMVSLFIFFNCFAINMVLQYKKVGPWRDYLFGEKVYIILSLAAKSALAWQVFAGTLAS